VKPEKENLFMDVKLLTTHEVAKLLECSSDAVRLYARLHKLKVALVVGRGQRLFYKKDVEKFLAQREKRARKTAA
jgi:excisionase family DNA binding protein